ncbi:MAG: CPBP family intramembrane metalloprotease [Sedimentisphaerales bacterium]|nr:CPBP family intramembrane metalloprotease [Sedimentisphaerales bacterium]
MTESTANLAVTNMTERLPLAPSDAFSSKTQGRAGCRCAIECLCLTIAVALAIKSMADSSLSDILWFLGPAVLVAAGLLPAILRKETFAKIGLKAADVKTMLPILARTCLVVFPLTFAGMWLVRSRGLEIPLRVAMPKNGQILGWLFYQFFYVAVAEEIFFRGYLQTNLMRIADAISGPRDWPALQKWIGIILAAACFAAAHVIVRGQAVAALTFLPGIVLGWLFIRTKSLLAPIIFHGLANTCYCIIAVALA